MNLEVTQSEQLVFGLYEAGNVFTKDDKQADSYECLASTYRSLRFHPQSADSTIGVLLPGNSAKVDVGEKSNNVFSTVILWGSLVILCH